MLKKIPKAINKILQSLCALWNVQIISVMAQPPEHNYLFLAYSHVHNKNVIVKILVADTCEAQALTIFDGHGCVRLLEYDSKTKGLLLECIKPGTTLKEFFPEKDPQALVIVVGLIKKLQTHEKIKQPKSVNSVADWLSILHTFTSTKIPKDLLFKAQKVSTQLLAKDSCFYFLHGDLHHENILKKHTEWVAIDPKGVFGPLEYEIGRFIMNPIPELLKRQNAQNIIELRIDTLSEMFGLEKQSVIDWLFVQTMLSVCWSSQGGTQEYFDYFIQFAQLPLFKG